MKKTIYVTEPDEQRIQELIALLEQRGVRLGNRHYASVSELLRWLVAEQLRRERNRTIADPDAPYPEDDPWDEMGFPAPRS